MSLDFKVDEALCTLCKECVRDCPSRVIEMPEGGIPQLAEDAEKNCIRCQHCLAICPTGAISILGKKPEDSTPIDPAALPSLEMMEKLIKGRRTTRRYKAENVPADIIDRLLDDAAYAAAGANRRSLTFNVVYDRERMKEIRQSVMEALKAASETDTIPKDFAYLHAAVPAFFKYRADLMFRGAPHILVVSAGKDAICPAEDVVIALSTFESAATSAGIGTTWCGMLKMALECVPGLKPLFGLSGDEPYYAMLFGIPNVKYARTVQRSGSAEIRRL